MTEDAGFPPRTRSTATDVVLALLAHDGMVSRRQARGAVSQQ